MIRINRLYQMWFTDVSRDPWISRKAESADGKRWSVLQEPVLEIDQAWESRRLFYPTVVKIDGAYLMWYGSYWSEHPNTTALGFAVSLDGIRWCKHPENPVFRPDPRRPWESHYVTSQSIMQRPDGSFRMWYASRKEPPFVNKYFAINTAKWDGLDKAIVAMDATRLKEISKSPDDFKVWRDDTRKQLRDLLGIPVERVPLNVEKRGQIEHDNIVIEKWVFTVEPGSRVPALLYRPKNSSTPAPAIVFTYSHGGSKSAWPYHYGGQLYAKLAIVSGWTYQDIGLRTKYCTKVPNQRMRKMITWPEYAALAAPDCAVLIMNGDADWVIDREDDNSGWAGMETAIEAAARSYALTSAAGRAHTFYEPGGGHRPYFVYQEALEWIHKYLGTPAKSLEEIRALPTINAKDWCDNYGIQMESFYSSNLHQGGATIPDLKIRALTREELSCLRWDELGTSDFTVEGWLQSIESN